ncbi:MAG: hypothetical protein ACP5N7_05280 [Candidatus Pacearchaeota archaeon]
MSKLYPETEEGTARLYELGGAKKKAGINSIQHPINNKFYSSDQMRRLKKFNMWYMAPGERPAEYKAPLEALPDLGPLADLADDEAARRAEERARRRADKLNTRENMISRISRIEKATAAELQAERDKTKQQIAINPDGAFSLGQGKRIIGRGRPVLLGGRKIKGRGITPEMMNIFNEKMKKWKEQQPWVNPGPVSRWTDNFYDRVRRGDLPTIGDEFLRKPEFIDGGPGSIRRRVGTGRRIKF